MNEFELIEQITHGIPTQSGGLIFGIGDDCAMIEGRNGKDMLVTTDSLYEGVHFKREWITPRALGRKSLSVNVSDIAAMGGKPLYYLVSIGIPKGFPENDVKELFDGMAQIAATFKMILIGGDTCASKSGLLITVTAIGEIDSGKALLRRGACPDDLVYVTGTLGGAALGLAALEKGMRSLEMREYLKRHDDPTARVTTGAWLAASTCVTSMIDISDGLAQDLSHIADASGVGINIFADLIPLNDGFATDASACHKDPLILALTGGEDYELAFTVPKEKAKLFEKMLSVVAPTFGHKVTKIGEVVTGSGVRVKDIHGTELPVSSKGFEHRF